eukprot:m.225872 g.225872  ORF g.225872 m.225872 type:complete len:405 (-) comp11330_c0_seq1:1183-2397(-)
MAHRRSRGRAKKSAKSHRRLVRGVGQQHALAGVRHGVHHRRPQPRSLRAHLGKLIREPVVILGQLRHARRPERLLLADLTPACPHVAPHARAAWVLLIAGLGLVARLFGAHVSLTVVVVVIHVQVSKGIVKEATHVGEAAQVSKIGCGMALDGCHRQQRTQRIHTQALEQRLHVCQAALARGQVQRGLLLVVCGDNTQAARRHQDVQAVVGLNRRRPVKGGPACPVTIVDPHGGVLENLLDDIAVAHRGGGDERGHATGVREAAVAAHSTHSQHKRETAVEASVPERCGHVIIAKVDGGRDGAGRERRDEQADNLGVAVADARNMQEVLAGVVQVVGAAVRADEDLDHGRLIREDGKLERAQTILGRHVHDAVAAVHRRRRRRRQSHNMEGDAMVLILGARVRH